MKIREILTEALAAREYPHLEEYLFIQGVDKIIDKLKDFKQHVSQPETLNIKWDGKAAIFWGRDENGVFYMVPNNQWNKGQKLTRQELANEIKRTGRKLPNQSDKEFAATRARMAAGYAAQWDLLEKSSPAAGFYWGDIMFDTPPALNNQGQYEFTPNKVTYYADAQKELGQAIKKGARLFIAVHGLVPEFGAEPTSQLQPVSQNELAALNRANPGVYLLSERPTSTAAVKNTKFIDSAIAQLSSLKASVDKFISYTAPKFTGLRGILRDYVNQYVKQDYKLDFQTYLDQSKLSDSQKALVIDYINKNKKPFADTMKAVNVILKVKDQGSEQLEKQQVQSMADRIGISASIAGVPGGEGFATIGAGGEGVKYVSKSFRAAPANVRFGG